MTETPMLEYRVKAHRVDAHSSTAETKEASLTLDTDLAGRSDAFNRRRYGTERRYQAHQK